MIQRDFSVNTYFPVFAETADSIYEHPRPPLLGRRQRDLDENIIRNILDWLSLHARQDRYRELVPHSTALGDSEQQEVLGESLPAGLILDLYLHPTLEFYLASIRK